MINDNKFLSENEINGIRSAIFSQEVPVFWTFHANEKDIIHYTKTLGGEESKFNILTENIIRKFCDNNCVGQVAHISSRILLLPQAYAPESLKVVNTETIIYVVDNSDSIITINGQQFESIAGMAILFNKGTPYYITNPKKSDFAAMIEVSISL